MIAKTAPFHNIEKSNGTSLWKQYNARNPDNIIRPFLEIVIDIQQYKTKVDEYFLVSDNLFK